jgi:hypothetical protein
MPYLLFSVSLLQKVQHQQATHLTLAVHGTARRECKAQWEKWGKYHVEGAVLYGGEARCCHMGPTNGCNLVCKGVCLPRFPSICPFGQNATRP